jgi:competence ComEA-like helix-hairpin-helix protein
MLRRWSCVAALALAIPFRLAAQADLPEGPGKDAAKKICGNCHEIETVISSRRTKIGWQQITDDMISRGAEGTDDEMAAVVAYLTASFGKINVNTAPVADLQKTLGLSEKEAHAITAYREQNGKIRNFEELEKVPGIEPEKLRQKRSLVAFSQ